MSAERKNVSLSLPAMEGELLPEENCYQAKLRAAVYDGVSETDVQEIVKGIVARAKAGDPAAQKLFFAQIAEQGEKLTRGGNRSRNAG